jgi:hypothetical protein
LTPYLSQRSTKSKNFFSELLLQPEVKRFREEVSACNTNHTILKDPEKHHKNFARLHELKEFAFAEKLALDICK